MRIDRRKVNQLRPVTITPDYLLYPEGSVLISMGKTKVLCNATVEERIPHWMQAQKKSGGWVTAEYAMLPRATDQRTARETNGLRGRTQEIRRLIGRSLRASVNLEKLGARTCIIDCDVIQADGGTRTASITGAYVALAIALNRLARDNLIPFDTLETAIAAISVGVVDNIPMLDLCYQEDASADVDVNVVMTAEGDFIEVQGTAERNPFSSSTLDELLKLAYKGIGELLTIQTGVLEQHNISSI